MPSAAPAQPSLAPVTREPTIETSVKVYKDHKQYQKDLGAMTARGFAVVSVTTTHKTALGGRFARLTVAPDIVVTYQKQGPPAMTEEEQEAWLKSPKQPRKHWWG